MLQMGDIAQWLSEFKSKDVWFNPLVGQGEEQFFCPSVNSGPDLFVSDPPLNYLSTACTQICAHVKDPMSICRKRLDLNSVVHENTAHKGKEKKRWATQYDGCKLSP